MSESVSQRCTATTNAGAPCKNRTARGTKCWVHLRRDAPHLRVKRSGVHGLGLYTTKRIKKNKKIATYKGQNLTRAQVNARYPNKDAKYVLCKTKNKCRDARKTTAGVARFANTARGTNKRNNARFAGYTLKTQKTREYRLERRSS